MILLDSSFLIAHYNAKDAHHQKAREIMEKIKDKKYGEVIITDYIFDECVTVLYLRLSDLNHVIEKGEEIKALEIIHIEEQLFEEAWNIFKEQKNTVLSFTDCSILATMNLFPVDYIATFDKDLAAIPGITVIK